MGFGAAVKSVFGKYASFTGRAPRSEFWWFYLFAVVVSLVLNVIDVALGWVVDVGSDTPADSSPFLSFFNADIGALSTVWAVVLILPYISVMVRRLHDTDRSGWWWWIQLIPCVGFIVLLVFVLLPGTRGDNRFGRDMLGSQPMM